MASRNPTSDAQEQGDKGRRRGRPWVGPALRLIVLFTVVFVVLSMTGWAERLVFYPSSGTPDPPAGAEEVWFRTADGLRLHGWFLPARGRGDASAAAVLVVHGNAGNIGNHIDFVDFLPAAGFHTLLFDYRSYGRSDSGSLRREALRTDTEAALDYLLSRSDVDAGRIGLYAQSVGGPMGLSVMVDRPEIRAGVVVSTFTAWREIAASALGGGDDPGWLSSFVARAVMPSGMDPIDLVRRVNDRPLLLVHGTEDEIVPRSHFERLGAAAGSNARSVLIDGGGHNDLRWVGPSFDREITAFFNEHLRRIEP
ncbi:MAG: alpha/beta hydrolase [Phycisphaerales bacterium]